MVAEDVGQAAGDMHDSKQIQFFAFTAVEVASRTDSEFFRQTPTLRKDPSRFGVVNTELLGIKIEQIETVVGSVSNNILVFPQVGN